MRTIALALALSATTLAAVKTGPAVGAKMPDFQLPDQDSKMHSVKDLMGSKGLVLVVYRSADW